MKAHLAHGCTEARRIFHTVVALTLLLGVAAGCSTARAPSAAAELESAASAGKAATAEKDKTSTATTVQPNSAKPKMGPDLRVAVPDLAYEQKVRDFFYQYNRNTNTSNKSSANNEAEGHKSGFDAQFTSTESVSAGTTVKMERAELRKFTADVKGELIKTNRFRVTQAKPWLQDESPSVFDVIERVKGGYFPNADLVLFGIINQIDFRTEDNPIQGTNTQSHGLYLDLVVEFSLIDTKTNEVVAAFSASGSGQDVRLGSGGSFNAAKVIQEASKELGRNVAEQIVAQVDRE